MTTITITQLANLLSVEDLLSFPFSEITVTHSDSTLIRATYGGYELRLEGSFVYDQSGITSGSTINAVKLYSTGNQIASITGMNVTYDELASGDTNTVIQATLGGDDVIMSFLNGGDLLSGYGGDDRIRLGTGDDTVLGGTGTDTFVLDTPLANAGFRFVEDVFQVISDFGTDTLFEFEAIEFQDATVHLLEGSAGADNLTGLTGLTAGGSAGFDIINGLGGNDTISGSASGDMLLGGDGDDGILGNGGGDGLFGQDGNDTLAGGGGFDTVWGGSGNDLLKGGGGNDRMFGGSGADRMIGGGRNDALHGNAGNDVLQGSKGRDLLKGGHGDDTLSGGAHGDRLKGNAGSDVLKGGNGNDKLFGGGGNDTLLGQKGDDRLTGGAGADEFVFHRNHGNDTVTDFQLGLDLIAIGRGASSLDQLSFQQQGADVLVSFSNVTILVEEVTVTQLQDQDNFLF
ncbi:calcium-binding protein [Roseobacteraceae bacterium NS-SX3]